MRKSDLLRVLRQFRIPRRYRAYVRLHCPDAIHIDAFKWAYDEAKLHAPLLIQWACTEVLSARLGNLRDLRSRAHTVCLHSHWTGDPETTNPEALRLEFHWVRFGTRDYAHTFAAIN